MSERRSEGRVIRIKKDLGYGFITANSGESIFFHASACKECRFETLEVGDKVSYLKVESEKGARALAVRVEEGA